MNGLIMDVQLSLSSLLKRTIQNYPEKEIVSYQTKSIHDFLCKHFAHWQFPRLSDILFVDVIPKTSVGKLDKKELRKKFVQ